MSSLTCICSALPARLERAKRRWGAHRRLVRRIQGCTIGRRQRAGAGDPSPLRNRLASMGPHRHKAARRILHKGLAPQQQHGALGAGARRQHGAAGGAGRCGHHVLRHLLHGKRVGRGWLHKRLLPQEGVRGGCRVGGPQRHGCGMRVGSATKGHGVLMMLQMRWE